MRRLLQSIHVAMAKTAKIKREERARMRSSTSLVKRTSDEEDEETDGTSLRGGRARSVKTNKHV